MNWTVIITNLANILVITRIEVIRENRRKNIQKVIINLKNSIMIDMKNPLNHLM